MKKAAKRKSIIKKISKKKFPFLPFVFGLIAITGVIVYLVISSNPAKNPQAAAREVGKWPFARNSIWNLPIGAGASYGSANFPSSTGNGINTEDEMIMIDTANPLRQTYMRTGQWNATCSGGSDFGSFHVPDGLITPLTSGSFLPNNTGAALKSDGKTIQEGIWIARCSGTGPLYWGYGPLGTHDIYGLGLVGGAGGGHGGSGLSAVGGSLRHWELQGDEPIRHALKLTVPTKVLSKSGNGGRGYKWPAVRADGGYDGTDCYSYSGSTQIAVMGALLALPPSVDVDLLVSTPLARRIGHAMQDYGVYVVDTNPCWDPFTFNVENKGGDIVKSRWGYGFGDNPLSGDLFKLINRLNVVTNWDEAGFNSVKDSNGAQGVGGGAPRVSWAPDFGQIIVDPLVSTPLPTPTPAPIAGSALEAENMVIRQGYQYPSGNVFSDSTASGGKGISLLSNGYLDGQIAGPFGSLTVRAKGDQCNGAPNMVVSIDGVSALTTSVPAISWADYTAAYSAGAGNHTVRADFTNDSNSGTCDRNLRLDIVKTSTTSDVDTDKDGFSDKVETYVGTDPNKTCGLNTWPPDVDGDGTVTLLDMTNVANSYLTKTGDAKYNKRYDMDANGAIAIEDLNIVASYFLQNCATPQMVAVASRPDVNQFIAPISKVIEAETFKLNSGYADPGKNIFSDSTASGGKGFILWSTGSAQTVTTNGFGKATLRVKADVCEGAPKLIVKIDGKILYSQDFAITSWTDVTVDFAAVAGTSHTIRVELANDRYRAGVCDRNLRFDKVTLL